MDTTLKGPALMRLLRTAKPGLIRISPAQSGRISRTVPAARETRPMTDAATRPLTADDAARFVDEWTAAWNRRARRRILGHDGGVTA
jgi:hypothetical protein